MNKREAYQTVKQSSLPTAVKVALKEAIKQDKGKAALLIEQATDHQQRYSDDNQDWPTYTGIVVAPERPYQPLS